MLVKRRKKVNIVVEQSSFPQKQLKMIEPIVYVLYETWFFHFFQNTHIFGKSFSEFYGRKLETTKHLSEYFKGLGMKKLSFDEGLLSTQLNFQ